MPRGPALPAPAGPAARARPSGTTGPVREHTTRRGPARGRRSRAAADQSRDAARYFAQNAEPGGVDALSGEDDRSTGGWEYPGWVEDELSALLPARGTLCVSCWIERPTAEQRRRDDDGLCGECRDDGVVGITAPGQDRAGRLRARVAHIAAHAANVEHARSLLRGEYRRARGADKALIVGWVDQHLPA